MRQMMHHLRQGQHCDMPQLLFFNPGDSPCPRRRNHPCSRFSILMRKAILWDNDGVLVDSERLFFQANRDYFRLHGIELSPRQFFDWYLRDDCGAWHLLGVSGTGIEPLRAQRNVIYNRLLKEATDLEVPGMASLLGELSGRVRMGIVTSSRRVDFMTIHTKLQLLPHFEFVLTGEDYTHAKPSPEPYLLGLEKLGICAEECLVVEDSPRGLQAARAAGIACIMIRTELTGDYDFPGAKAVVDNAAELADTLQGLL